MWGWELKALWEGRKNSCKDIASFLLSFLPKGRKDGSFITNAVSRISANMLMLPLFLLMCDFLNRTKCLHPFSYEEKGWR